jgi:hypothetical protein
MKKLMITAIIAIALGHVTDAQKKDEKKYSERAEEIRTEIWGDNTMKQFLVKDIPEKYKNESVVVIARFYETSSSTKRKAIYFSNGMQKYKYFTTFRERVKINDKTALDEYSTLEYKKSLKNTLQTSIFFKIEDTYKTYLGIKILKPDGSEKVVNTDEEVLTKNEASNKQGKLAISDLQVGDILDYYIKIEEVENISNTSNGNIRGTYSFYLGADHPIMNYQVRFILNDKCGADVMSFNGAKPMKETTNEDGEKVVEMSESDIPKVTSAIWTSLVRQIPYYSIRYQLLGSNFNGIHFKKGVINHGPFFDEYLVNVTDYFTNLRKYDLVDMAAEKEMVEHFGGRKAMKDVPADSIINFVYTYIKASSYPAYSLSDIDVSNKNYNYRSLDMFKNCVLMSEILYHYNIDHEILLTTSRYTNRLADVIVAGDFDCILKITGGNKFKYVGFSDYFNLPGEIPAIYQGENAISLIRGGVKRVPKYENTKDILIPATGSDENKLSEVLNVSFMPDNLQMTKIQRTSTATGSMKQGSQKSILLSEQVGISFSKSVGLLDIIQRLSDNKKNRAKAEELQNAFNKEKPEQKKYFEEEIKDQYDVEPKELISYAVLKDGLTINDPAFVFTSTFTMDNWVKKAGNNYIFEIGKLMGTYSKTEEKDRKRTLDIYMAAARTFEYQFNVQLPKGFTVKGLEALNKEIKNDISSFKSTAKVTGETLNVTVSRSFKNNFEKAANFPKLLEVMDASSDFTTQKVLLEKIK